MYRLCRCVSKTLSRYAFCVILFLFYVLNGYSQSKSRAYYVSNSGNDKNSGNRGAPFRTIQRINKVKLRPGDSILLKGGQVFKGTFTINKIKSDITKKPVYIFSNGEGSAIIDGGDKSGIIADGIRRLHINNIALKGSGRKEGNNADGVIVNNCDDVSINNLEVSGFQKSGLLINSSSNVTVSKVHSFDNGFAGILVEGQNDKQHSKNILIKDCIAENNPGDPTQLNNHSGNGILVGHSTSVKIEYCVATNNGWDMPRTGNGPVGIWCYESDSITIQYCISYKNKTSKDGDDGGGFDLDGGVTNSVIRYCLSYENEGSAFGIFQYAGASPWGNNKIYKNISENDGSVSAAHASAYVWNSSGDAAQFSNFSFLNNILFNSKGASIHYAQQSNRKSFDFKDNIFIAKGNVVLGELAADSYNNNNWWILSTRPGEDSSARGTSLPGDGNAAFINFPGYSAIGNTISDPHKLKSVIEKQLLKYRAE